MQMHLGTISVLNNYGGVLISEVQISEFPLYLFACVYIIVFITVGACQCCRSQHTSRPDQSLVGRLRERVIQGLSDSQRNQLARENHFAAAATDIKNFRYLCNMLNLTSKDITAIEYNHRYDGEKEQAYQALYKWMQCSELAINVGNLANVLASAGESDAVNNLIEYCTHC